MPYTLPRDMARQLQLVGDVIDFDKRRRMVMGEVAGSRMPIKGPMGGGGTVTQMPSRAQMGHDAETSRRIAERLRSQGSSPDQAAYEAAVARQQGARAPQQQPMERMAQEAYRQRAMLNEQRMFRENTAGPGAKPADTAQTSFPRAQEMMALREKLEMARYGRLLNDQERATLNRPGWEQPQ